MSYHLRALERWGVVERAEGTGDSRNRPWRAAGTTIVVGGEGPGAEVAHQVLWAETSRALQERMTAARRRPKGERPPLVGMASGDLWLTDEQAEAFSLVVERAIVELYESGWVNEPGPGKTQLTYLWSLLPSTHPRTAPTGEAADENEDQPAGSG